MSVPLLTDTHLVPQYLGPLALLEHNTLPDEFKDDETYVHTIVSPAMDYWKHTIEGKKGDQLE